MGQKYLAKTKITYLVFSGVTFICNNSTETIIVTGNYWHSVCGILFHSWMQMSLKSARFFGLLLCTAVLRIRHKFSKELRSRDWLGHERTLSLLSILLLISAYVWDHYLAERTTCAGYRIFLHSEVASAPVSSCTWNHPFFHQWCGVPLYHGQ